MDPQINFRLHGEAYLSRLDFLPKKVDVLDILHFDVSIYVEFSLDPKKLTTIWSEKGQAPTINHMSLGENEARRPGPSKQMGLTSKDKIWTIER